MGSLIPIMTSDNGKVSLIGNTHGTYGRQAWYAFNGVYKDGEDTNVSNHYNNYVIFGAHVDGSIIYDFENPTCVKSIEVHAVYNKSWGMYTPSKITVFGDNNGVEVNLGTMATSNTWGGVQTLNLNNNTTYTKYRVEFARGGEWTNVAEIQMYGKK